MKVYTSRRGTNGPAVILGGILIWLLDRFPRISEENAAIPAAQDRGNAPQRKSLRKGRKMW